MSARSGATVSIELGEDGLLGAHLLATMEGVLDDDAAGFAEVLRFTLERGISERLTAAGMAWPPTAESFELAESIGEDAATADQEADDETAEEEQAKRRAVLRSAGIAAVAVAAAVVIIGGYAFKWSWTGFTDNNQLWDWLHLLLLPVAFGAFPLWLKYSEYMSPARRRALGAVVLVFAVFVIAGYLVPLAWTGFKGQKLWDWLTLILLPITIITFRAWPKTGRGVHRGHIVVLTAISVGLAVTIIGGYAGKWTWTGYDGNTLWDWLTLLLAPAAVATVVAPALAKLVSGNAEARATEQLEQEAREEALQVAHQRAELGPGDR